MRNILTSIKKCISTSIRGKKSWKGSQKYEFKAAREFMETPFFSDLMIRNKKLRDEQSNTLDMGLLFSDFFQNDQMKVDNFVGNMTGKNCLEVGPCCSTVLANWWFIKNRYIIEPLLSKIKEYQTARFGYTLFDETINYACPAEILITELIGKIDGAIICRNCIDHTPNWPFVLNNMVSYMAPGATLLIWNDIYHLDGVDEGHYDITDNIENYKSLLSNLGLIIGYEFSYDVNKRRALNYGCIAQKAS